MSILNLYQPARRNALPVLLRFFENEVAAWDGPALGYAGEGHGALGGQVEVVGGAEGEVGHEFEVADGVGAELEVCDGDAVGGGAAHGLEVEGLDGAREAGGTGCGRGLEGGWWCYAAETGEE